MGRPVVHWELMSKDPAKVSAYYEKLFDWKIQHMPEINYPIVDTRGEGGILKPEHEGPWPANILFYICRRRPCGLSEKVVAASGEIHVEEQQVPGMGAFSVFTDPEGRMHDAGC